MLYKIKIFLTNHIKGVMLFALVCVMTFCTAIYMIVPLVQSLNTYNQIIDDVGGEEKIAELTSQSEDNDLFSKAEISQNTAPTIYADTDEYKEKQSEIDFKAERYRELKSDLMLTINKNITDFFIAYTEYSQLQTSTNLKKLKQYVTDDFYENHLKCASVKKDIYQLNYVRFADFDKDPILAFVEIKNSDKKYILSYVEQENKGWVISNIQSV